MINSIAGQQGDKVALGAMDDEFPNWVFITNDAGVQGWDPIQYIDKVEKRSEGIML